jgi:uncharacterized membrane protein (UPF0182 family)
VTEGPTGPPPIVFRFQRRRYPSFHGARWLVLIVLIVVLFALASIFRSVYTSYLWFDSLGYASVYSTEIVTKTWLFLAGAGVFLAIIGANLLLARKLAPVGLEASFIPDVEPATLHRIMRIVAVAGSLFLAVVFGSVASGEWDTVLRFTNAVSFGRSDPGFHKDIAFYMFDLPMYRFVQGWLVGAVIVTTLAVIAVYAFALSLQNFELHISRAMKAHVGGLLVALLLLFAGGYVLSIFELNLSKNGVVQGATYADMHARVPGYFVLIAVTLVACAGVIATIFRRGYAPAILGGVLWIVVLILALGVYPAAVQRFSVDPNELATELPYIQRNITMTRAAFNLDTIDEQPFQANSAVSPSTISQNQQTIDNLRLWDPRYTLNTYKQQQEIRPLYIFNDVDVDRYTLNGAYTEVDLAPRELSESNLPVGSQSWTNVHTQYTHGFGAVMNAVNKTDADGLPVYSLENIPPAGQPQITEPRIYYGQSTNDYVIVDTKQAEFDYQTNTGDSASNRYDARRGIQIGSFLRRLAFAWDLGDLNVLVSGQITSDSRLLIHRNIRDRVEQIAPFLTLDRDPYLVVVDGRLVWMQDAYTTSTNYPYSEAASAVGDIPDGTDYIRNSVKITIDAYTGDVNFYVVDPSDPVIATWQRMRYPEDLFTLQSNVFQAYHMTDPRVFYNKEDLWATPHEGTAGATSDVAPYYVMMQLPGESSAEFVLIRPFTPANKANAVAWMGARSDGANYGKLAVYRFPADSLTPGPQQVESSIDAQPQISQRFSLLNVQGSQIQRGNLLLIPLGDSYLYVEPVYLQAQQTPIPAVIAVIVYANNNVYMEPTLTQALAVAMGTAPPTYSVASVVAGLATQGAAAPAQATGTPRPGATPARTATAAATAASSAVPPTPAPSATDIASLVQEAAAAEQAAQDRLRAGDFAGYGQEEARLRAALDRLDQAVGLPTPTPAP